MTKRRLWPLISLLVLMSMCGGYALYDSGRPAPVPLKRALYEGVTYRRIVRYFPRFRIIHLLEIDVKTKGLQFFVTEPDQPDEAQPLLARTTSQFLKESGAQIAVNGGGFSPWWSRSPADYYPHVGDPVTPNGFTASYGAIYARAPEDVKPKPIMYISRRNEITFNKIPGKVIHAISGDRMLLEQGQPVTGLNNSKPDPRTAIGVNKNGRWVYIVVIDGRQPIYSEGATFMELADLMKDFGAYYAMNLDGGGSSTLAMAGEQGQAVLLNSPIDSYIPGRERPVADHIGIYVQNK
jgi:exopolysaccharide biosynthesis protein